MGRRLINLARGVIVTNAKADPVPAPLTAFFGPASFHDNDYTFYYNNIKDNVAKRIAAYKATDDGKAIHTALVKNKEVW